MKKKFDWAFVWGFCTGLFFANTAYKIVQLFLHSDEARTSHWFSAGAGLLVVVLFVFAYRRERKKITD